ncbi:hypothetical protein IFO69_05320 [Echinicola sp. CAU 1574]|uniref:Uncharacterized protein n=1 Tax=Echinicola arenosa TaxID=2774144 RepID=A0ABR9AHF6_9BACT|nr:hypothetical protein [Echinicola arenosa]MBD8488161.1 hypothetical protein [Echinicola arenosa]
MREYQLEIFADYFQFHLYDEKLNPNFGEAWNQFSVDNFLALRREGIGIGTIRNMDVPVNIKIYDSEPKIKEDLNQVFQINETDLTIISGKLVVIGCTEYFPDAKRIELDRGIYRVRIYYSDLDKLSEDGLDGEDNYHLEIWKTDNTKEPIFNKIKPAPKKV